MTEVDADYAEDLNNDVCPICKTDKYLNPNMKFLINPECYHKICDLCVDRIFSLGPSKCPYKGCEMILRKNKFKTQIFEDIGVEKEIDIRNKINKIFNKTEKDFKTLDDYNAHLEKVEELVYNLLNGIDVQKTNEYIQKYKQENQKTIHQNNINLQRQHEIFEQIENKKRLINLEKQKLLKQLIRELQRDKIAANKQMTNTLSNSSMDVKTVVENVKKNFKKQTSARRRKFEEETKRLQEKLLLQEDLEILNYNNPGMVSKRAVKPLSPFSPFIGDRDPKVPFQLEPEYYDPFSSGVAADKVYLAGGIRVEQIYKKSLFEAFLGLGCVVEEEKV